MKINELISEQTDLDEGVGSFLGKAAGHVVGGLGAAWRDAKQGYKDAKAVWDPKDPPGTYNNNPAAAAPQAPTAGTPPATGTAPAPQAPAAPAPGNAPAPQQSPAPTAAPAPGAAPTPQQAPAPADTGAIGSIMQAVDKLDPATKKQLAGELEKSINTPAPAAKPPPAPAAGATPTPGAPAPADSGKDHGLGKQSDGKFITPGQKFDTANGSPIAPAPASTPKTPPATEPAPAPATPPAAKTPPTTGGKLTKAQQDAKKAELLGKRQAGKTTATQTGGGFKDYVGGSGERMTGVDASGAPIYQKIQREGIEFRSNFLGMMI